MLLACECSGPLKCRCECCDEMTFYINGSMLVCFVQVDNCKAVKRNMESEEQYTDYTPLTYPSATAGPPAYPAPDPAPGPTPYPPPGSQQYQPQSQYPPPAQQYPPASKPPAYGQVYGYDQPPAEYPPQPGYGAPQKHPQQQQQQVVVVSAAQRPALVVHHVQSYAGHIVFACFVMWICNPLFGFIAFILAG